MKDKTKIIVGSHTWHHEVETWTAPIDYDTWHETVCGAMVGNESSLRAYYDAQWDAMSCKEYLITNKMLWKAPKPKKPPKERVVTLDDAAINRRYALCLWRESQKLVTRRMTPSARQIVNDMSARMAGQLGISPDEN